MDSCTGEVENYRLWNGILTISEGLIQVKCVNDKFVYYKHKYFNMLNINIYIKYMLIGELELSIYLWIIVTFKLSFWRHPFAAEDPLVSKLCNAIFLQIGSNGDISSYTVHLEWPVGKYIFIKCLGELFL